MMLLLVAACGILPLGGCATASREPANLDVHKAEIRVYVKTGRYAADLERVAHEAQRWLQRRVAQRATEERLAVVLDLDETLFLNWSRIDESDFTYVPADWDRWVAQASAPAIESVRDLFQQARRADIDVFLITGRPERHRRDTELNLQRLNCRDYQELICSPDGTEVRAATFKAAQRQRLVREGWTIIANLGDQESDLTGGFAERSFKLPNPFYLTK